MITIARLTIREAARRRILWVLLALTIVSVGLTSWGTGALAGLARTEGATELEIRIGVSQILILAAFMFSFILAMTAAFLGAPAIANDLESGIALALLARPIRRSATSSAAGSGWSRSWPSTRPPRASSRSAPWPS